MLRRRPPAHVPAHNHMQQYAAASTRSRSWRRVVPIARRRPGVRSRRAADADARAGEPRGAGPRGTERQWRARPRGLATPWRTATRRRRRVRHRGGRISAVEGDVRPSAGPRPGRSAAARRNDGTATGLASAACRLISTPSESLGRSPCLSACRARATTSSEERRRIGECAPRDGTQGGWPQHGAVSVDAVVGEMDASARSSVDHRITPRLLLGLAAFHL